LAWLLVPVAAILAVGPVREADVYWHIRMGADILANGRFGGDEAWTYGPAVASWQTTQAAAEVLLHLVHTVASWPGIMLLRVLLAAVVVASLLLAVTAVAGRRPAIAVDRSAALVGLIVTVMIPSLVQERPQSLSLVILPWVGVLVLRVMYTDRWPRWWVLGPLVMVWAWFHGAAILVGPLLVTAAVVHALGGQPRTWLPRLATSLRRGWPTLLAVGLAPLLGPLGVAYYGQVARIQDAAAGRIVEWMPVAGTSVALWLAVALIGAWGVAVVHIVARSGSVWPTVRMDALLIAVLLMLMSTSSRALAVGVLVLSPLVVRRLAQAWTGPPRRLEVIHRAFSITVLSFVSATAVLVVALAATTVRQVGEDYPLRIWQGLSAQPGERRALVDYTLGGQAGLLGSAVVSVDGRADRYGASVIDGTRAFVVGRAGWQGTLAEYPGTTDIVIPAYGGVAPQLEDLGWTVRCADRDYLWLTAPGVTGACPSESAD
jgi:hypothetical protein